MANLEKQREKEKAEKAEKERIEKLEREKVEKEKREKEKQKEREENGRKLKIQAERLKETEKQDRGKNIEKTIEKLTSDGMEKIKAEKERIIREQYEKDRKEEVKLAACRTKYKKLIEEKCNDEDKVNKARKEWEIAEEEKRRRDLELRRKIDDEDFEGKMEMVGKIQEATMAAIEDMPSESETESEIETEVESEVEDGNVTMVEKQSEGKEDEDYEGIHYMKNQIKEVEAGCRPDENFRTLTQNGKRFIAKIRSLMHKYTAMLFWRSRSITITAWPYDLETN